MVSVLFVQMATSVFPLASEIQTSPKGLWAGRLNGPMSLQVPETFYPYRCGAGGHCHSWCCPCALRFQTMLTVGNKGGKSLRFRTGMPDECCHRSAVRTAFFHPMQWRTGGTNMSATRGQHRPDASPCIGGKTYPALARTHQI